MPGGPWGGSSVLKGRLESELGRERKVSTRRQRYSNAVVKGMINIRRSHMSTLELEFRKFVFFSYLYGNY